MRPASTPWRTARETTPLPGLHRPWYDSMLFLGIFFIISKNDQSLAESGRGENEPNCLSSLHPIFEVLQIMINYMSYWLLSMFFIIDVNK